MNLADTDTDILIVGGGIYGCGIAQAAAASGYRVRLIERGSIACATSSQSTKLIHGGLRYLEQLNLKLVYEALSECETLLRIAPSLVQKEWFYIPIYVESKRPWWWVGCGLLLYWLLSAGRSGIRIVPRSQWDAVLPQLNREGLRMVFAYQDGATDDAALTRAVAASAQSFGCEVSEHCALEHAEYAEKRWVASLSDGSTCHARILINAAGAWMHDVCALLSPTPPQASIKLVQGTHLLLDRDCSSFIYTESTDARVMFFRPWQGRMLVGTTEKALSCAEEAMPTEAEITAILSTYNRYFPNSPCTKNDILAYYCGIRVLPLSERGAFASNRETVMLCDSPKSLNYIGVYGGKLTTYRRESAKALKLIARLLPLPHQVDTRKIPLG